VGLRSGRADGYSRVADAGCGRVIAIDRVPERLRNGSQQCKAETINFDKEDVYRTGSNAMTEGRDPDRCIDAVGCEAPWAGDIDAVVDNVKAGVKLATDRAHVLRQAIFCCRKGGTVSGPGVYVGLIDKMPFGAAMNKGLTIKSGQTQSSGREVVCGEDRAGANRSIIQSLRIALPSRKRQLLTRPFVTGR